MGKLDSRINELFSSVSLRRSGDIAAAGISRVSPSRALAARQVKRLARGLYCLADYQANESGDLALVARKVPDAIICLLSEIWIAIPHNMSPVRNIKTHLSVGIIAHSSS